MKLMSLCGKDKKGTLCACIHPDVATRKEDKDFLRGNVFSPKDPICIFCGKKCKLDPCFCVNEKKFHSHFVGKNFVYCSLGQKAIRLKDYPGGELCPKELGGCGKAIP